MKCCIVEVFDKIRVEGSRSPTFRCCLRNGHPSFGSKLDRAFLSDRSLDTRRLSRSTSEHGFKKVDSAVCSALPHTDGPRPVKLRSRSRWRITATIGSVFFDTNSAASTHANFPTKSLYLVGAFEPPPPTTFDSHCHHHHSPNAEIVHFLSAVHLASRGSDRQTDRCPRRLAPSPASFHPPPSSSCPSFRSPLSLSLSLARCWSADNKCNVCGVYNQSVKPNGSHWPLPRNLQAAARIKRVALHVLSQSDSGTTVSWRYTLHLCKSQWFVIHCSTLVVLNTFSSSYAHIVCVDHHFSFYLFIFYSRLQLQSALWPSHIDFSFHFILSMHFPKSINWPTMYPMWTRCDEDDDDFTIWYRFNCFGLISQFHKSILNSILTTPQNAFDRSIFHWFHCEFSVFFSSEVIRSNKRQAITLQAFIAQSHPFSGITQISQLTGTYLDFTPLQSSSSTSSSLLVNFVNTLAFYIRLQIKWFLWKHNHSCWPNVTFIQKKVYWKVNQINFGYFQHSSSILWLIVHFKSSNTID